MHLLNCLLLTLTAVSIATGQDDDEEAETLIIKPVGAEHLKPLDGPAMFTCEVQNAKDEVDYQLSWTNSAGVELRDTSGSSRVYVEQDGNVARKVYITKVIETDAGTYTCSATIDGQKVTKSTKLNLFKEITFEDVPPVQYPIIHTNATITCVVSGNPEPKITWRKGANSIKTGGNSRFSKDKKGLIIRDVTLADNGLYTCRAEVEAAGRYGTRNITVEVHIPPKISKSPGRVENVEGHAAAISCDATGLPKPTFEFLKTQGGVSRRVEQNDRVVIEAGTLKFVKLIKSDEGEYTCRASNDAGNDTAIGHLHVFVKPKIFELQNSTQIETGTANLICRSDGDPVPEMTFRKADEDTDLADDEDDRIAVKQNGNVLTLTISKLKPDDSAIYTCRSTNAHGTDQAVGKISVQYKPKMVPGQKAQVYTWTGRQEGSNISCHANGEPLPTYSWTSKTRPLLNNDTFHVFNESGVSYLQVKVREVDQSWIYTEYTCTARNQLGSAEYKFELKRASTPSSPLNVTVENISPTTADLLVQAPVEDGGLPIVEYIIEYEGTVLTSPSGQAVVMKNLKPSTNYSVQVKAKNEVGLGDPFVLAVVTEPSRRPYPVKILSSEHGLEHNTYLIKWQVPNTGGSPITQYKIKYRMVGDVKTDPMPPAEEVAFVRVSDQNQQQVEKKLTGLMARKSYRVEIQAENTIGWSDPNEEFVFTTSEDPFTTPPPETTVQVNHLPDVENPSDPASDSREVTSAEIIIVVTGNGEEVGSTVNSGRRCAVVDARGLCVDSDEPPQSALADVDSASASVPLGLVVAVVLVLMLITLIVIDVVCNYVNHCGVTHRLCVRVRGGKKSREVTIEKGESEHMVKKQPIQTAVKEIKTEPTSAKSPPSTNTADVSKTNMSQGTENEVNKEPRENVNNIPAITDQTAVIDEERPVQNSKPVNEEDITVNKVAIVESEPEDKVNVEPREDLNNATAISEEEAEIEAKNVPESVKSLDDGDATVTNVETEPTSNTGQQQDSMQPSVDESVAAAEAEDDVKTETDIANATNNGEELHDSLVNAEESASDSNPSTARKMDDTEQQPAMKSS